MLPDQKKGADGGLTIILQMASLGAGLENNWLPVPDEPFDCWLRVLAESSDLDGSPLVRREC